MCYFSYVHREGMAVTLNHPLHLGFEGFLRVSSLLWIIPEIGKQSWAHL
jgi:hypothetical protein